MLWAAEGGGNCDKRNVFDKRNVVVESMGCRGGRKILIKGSQVGSHKCNNFDASEMFSPDPIHAGWEVSNGFCVAGATISMPLRCSPLTLYMLVGKGQMAFVWQVQQFRCLWDDFPWSYTCLLGRVKWLLCGRCNKCDASEMISPDPIHACSEGSNGFCVAGATISDASEMFSPDPIHAGWEVSNGFCVAGAAILMPLRWSPLTLYMLVGKCQMALCGRCNNFDASEMFSPDPIHACWEGSNGFCVAGAANFDASEMISPKMEGQRNFSVILFGLHRSWCSSFHRPALV